MSLSPLEAYEAVIRFARERGQWPLRLAMHAAVTQSFRPLFLHLIKLNFLLEIANDPTVESDVLLSPFCEEIGAGYFQFEPQVRALLLENLQAEYATEGASRLRAVAGLLLTYVQEQERTIDSMQDRLSQSYIDVQRWIALSILDPENAAHQLAAALNQVAPAGASSVRLQIGSLVSLLAGPLLRYPRLADYALGVQALERGEVDKARGLLAPLGDGEIEIGPVKLRPAATLLGEWGASHEPLQSEGSQKLGTQEDLQRSYGKQARHARNSGQLREAMELLKKQEAICIELLNKDALQQNYGDQALTLMDWGDPHEAMAQLKKQEAICLELSNIGALQQSYGNQALILKVLGHLDEAMALLKKQEAICLDLANKDALQRNYGNQALILKDWGQLDKAMALLRRQEEICVELGNQKDLGSCYITWSELARERGDHTTEKRKLEEAISIFARLGMSSEVDELKTQLNRPPEERPNSRMAFFSYSRDDSGFALKLAEDLRAAGASVWIDQLDINPGNQWRESIERALSNSSHVLVILSPAGVGSAHLSDEVTYAQREGKRIIPILYRDCTIPFRLRTLQYVDLRTDYSAGIKSILDELGVTEPAGVVDSSGTTLFAYSRSDSEFTLKVAADLKAAGVNAWIDQLDIEPGQEWVRAIQDAIDKCSNLLVVLSPESVRSDVVRRELDFALSRGKKIIPVLYRDCEIPFSIRNLNYVDFRADYGHALKRLTDDFQLDRRTEVNRPTSTRSDSLEWPDQAPELQWPMANHREVRLAFEKLLTRTAPWRILVMRGPSVSGKSHISRQMLRNALRQPDLACGRFDFRGTSEMDEELRAFVQTLDVPLPPAAPHLNERLGYVLDVLEQHARPTLLIFDTYEASGEVGEWIEKQLLPRVIRSPWLRVVITGQVVPDRTGAIWESDAGPIIALTPPSPADWFEYGRTFLPELTLETVEQMCKLTSDNASQLQQMLGPKT